MREFENSDMKPILKWKDNAHKEIEKLKKQMKKYTNAKD